MVLCVTVSVTYPGRMRYRERYYNEYMESIIPHRWERKGCVSTLLDGVTRLFFPMCHLIPIDPKSKFINNKFFLGSADVTMCSDRRWDWRVCDFSVHPPSFRIWEGMEMIKQFYCDIYTPVDSKWCHKALQDYYEHAGYIYRSRYQVPIDTKFPGDLSKKVSEDAVQTAFRLWEVEVGNRKVITSPDLFSRTRVLSEKRKQQELKEQAAASEAEAKRNEKAEKDKAKAAQKLQSKQNNKAADYKATSTKKQKVPPSGIIIASIIVHWSLFALKADSINFLYCCSVSHGTDRKTFQITAKHASMSACVCPVGNLVT